MADLPEVSVLVPAFDVELYLDAALASLAAQTFDAFEVIVADDASRDATAALAEGWCRRDPRIRLVRNERNLGMTENWNRGLAEARGPLVFKLDADDTLEPETLARLVAALRADAKVRFASCRTIECDEALAPVEFFAGERALLAAGIDPRRDVVQAGWQWFDLCFDDHQLWHSSAQMHRRVELLAAEGWDPTWGCVSDTDLLLRLLATERPVAHLGYVGVRYRRRSGSVSNIFTERGWKLAEATLVTAKALASRRGRARRIGRLRRNWWRIHCNAVRLRSNADLWSTMPERVREKLWPVAEALPAPPLDVCAEGRLRDALWAIRQLVRGSQ